MPALESRLAAAYQCHRVPGSAGGRAACDHQHKTSIALGSCGTFPSPSPPSSLSCALHFSFGFSPQHQSYHESGAEGADASLSSMGQSRGSLGLSQGFVRDFFSAQLSTDHTSLAPVIIHSDTICDGCGMNPIRGVLWRCVDCPTPPGFDLCFDCLYVFCVGLVRCHSKIRVRFSLQCLGRRHAASTAILIGYSITLSKSQRHEYGDMSVMCLPGNR